MRPPWCPWRAERGSRFREVLAGSCLALGVAILALAVVLAWRWLASSGAVEQTVFAVIPLCLSAGLLGTAAYVFGPARSDGMRHAYVLMLASMSMMLSAAFDQVSTQSLNWAWIIGMAMAGGAFAHLATVFPRDSIVARRLPGMAIVGYILAAFGCMYGLWGSRRGIGLEESLRWPGALLIWVLVSGGAYLLIHIIYAASSSPAQRLQSRVVSGAMLLWLGPLVYAAIAAQARASNYATYVALPSVLPCLAVGYSMFRFRVSGTTHWLRQGVVYGLLAAFILVAYSLIVAGATLVFRGGTPATSPLWIAGLALAVALLVDPVRRRLQALIDRMFLRGDKALAEAASVFSTELNVANDLDAIGVAVRRVTEDALQPMAIHVFVRDETIDQYVALRDASNRPSTELSFDPRGSLAAFLSQAQTPQVVDVRRLPAVLQPDRNRLSLLGTGLFLPLVSRGRLLGWLALGPRRTGEGYSTLNMAFLEQLGDQISLAMGRVEIVQNLERRIRDMNALTRVAQGVNITLTFDDVLELIYAQTAQIVPLTHFYITLHDAKADSSSFAFALENNERVSGRENVALPPRMGLGREVLRRGRPIITANYDLECSSAALTPETAGIRSWMGVPLNAGAESIGVISVGNREVGITYSQAQLELLQAIADQTAGAIVKARLLRETQARAAQLGKLNDVTRQVASTLDMASLQQVIVDGAAAILDCEAAIFYAPDQSTGELLVRAVAGDAPQEALNQSAPPGVGHVYRAAASRAPEIEQSLDVSSGSHVLAQFPSAIALRSSMAVPLQFQDTLVGIVEVLNRRGGGPFVAEDESLLLAFAGQAVVALENVRLYTLTDQELTARVEELSVMQRIDRELNASLEMDRAMRITLEWALRQSNAEAGLIGLLANDRLRIIAEMGYGTSPADATDQTVSLTFPGYQAAVDTALPQRVRFDVVGTGGFLASSDHQIVVPIRREATVIGLLVLESTRTAQEDLGFLSRLSDHAAIAISNAQLYDEVQRANIAKSDFVSLVAHELKNPMTSIKGYTELLAAGAVGPVTDMQAQFLNTIRSNTERMSTLVSDLNDNSKIEAGKLRLDFKAVELVELIDEIVRSSDKQNEEKKQQVGLELADQLPQVWADRTRLGQVFTNLVSNATQVHPRGWDSCHRC